MCGEPSGSLLCNVGVWVTIGVVLILIFITFLALSALLLRRQRRQLRHSHVKYTASGSGQLLLKETPRCISADSGCPTSSPATSYLHANSNTSAQSAASTSSDRAHLVHNGSDRSPARSRTLLPPRTRQYQTQDMDNPMFRTLMVNNRSAHTPMSSSLHSPAGAACKQQSTRTPPAAVMYVNRSMMACQSSAQADVDADVDFDAAGRLSRTLPLSSTRGTASESEPEEADTYSSHACRTSAINASHHYPRYLQPLAIDGSLGYSIGTLGVAPISPRSSSAHSSQSESGSGTMRAEAGCSDGPPSHHLSQVHIPSSVPNYTLHRSRSRHNSASNTCVELAAVEIEPANAPSANLNLNASLKPRSLAHRQTRASESASETLPSNQLRLKHAGGRPPPPPVHPHGPSGKQKSRAGLVSASEFTAIDGSPPNHPVPSAKQPQLQSPENASSKPVEPEGVFLLV